jgi:hypothetical protein
MWCRPPENDRKISVFCFSFGGLMTQLLFQLGIARGSLKNREVFLQIGVVCLTTILFGYLLVFHVYMDALDSIVKNLVLHLCSCCGISGDVKTISFDSASLNDAYTAFSFLQALWFLSRCFIMDCVFVVPTRAQGRAKITSPQEAGRDQTKGLVLSCLVLHVGHA